MGDERRRNYFIKKGFQAKFILKFCSLVISGAVISGAILFSYIFLRGTVTTAFINSRLSIISTADYVLPILVVASIIAVVIIGLGTIFTVLFISHRIAGPLYRIEKSVEAIGAGNLNVKIVLRTTDEVQNMAEKINDMTHSLNVNFRKIKDEYGKFDELVNKMMEAALGEKNLPDDKREVFQKISAERDKIKEMLKYFKV
ncbi:MAG: HAMP domain-containing protein [Candidatus Omnitrophica bacterium]|nr:HAMP domain-containing protein [Candidatus Omnitrophota bacterium]